ncbi:hypothetical protein niasHS_013535 [Heterodera schachtii]|uniref:Uncharacterized protein n=1 Tax=Heterodera schachtii TaxID=97005 RepID=A0ABD2I753_HETSC
MFRCLIITLFLVSLQFVPPNAEWSPWNHWSLCFEHSAGISAQTRTRACLGVNANKCQGSDTQARACLSTEPNINRDEPSQALTNPPLSIAEANAEWTLWSEWTECQSLPMGSSRPFRTRWRICDRRKCELAEAVSEKLKCIPCHGTPVEQRHCAEPGPFKKHSDHCQWNEWSAWSPCSTTCGSGTRRRIRDCPCQKCLPERNSREEQNCYNLLPCPSPNQPPPFSVFSLAAVPFFDASKTQLAPFDPCSACPPNYPLPCYTCLNTNANW